MVRHQGPKRDGLRIGHINTRTLKPKITTIRSLMKYHCFDILAISESNLTLKDRNATIAAEDYYIERFDRTNDGKGRGGPGGGVLCYIHKSINYDKGSITKSEGANNTQLLAIHLTYPVDLDLVIIYNPPMSRHEKQLEMLLTSLLWGRDPSRHILIIGDVNVNYFEPTSRSFFSTIETLNLQQLIDFYTRIEVVRRSSCVDHIYIQQKSMPYIIESGVVNFLQSDHDVIYCTWLAPTLVKRAQLNLYSSITESELDREILVEKKIKKPTKDLEEALRDREILVEKKIKKPTNSLEKVSWEYNKKAHLNTAGFNRLLISDKEDLCQDMNGVSMSDASHQYKFAEEPALDKSAILRNQILHKLGQRRRTNQWTSAGNEQLNLN